MLLFTAGFGPMWKILSLLIKASALTGVTLLQTYESSEEAVLNKEGFNELFCKYDYPHWDFCSLFVDFRESHTLQGWLYLLFKPFNATQSSWKVVSDFVGSGWSDF